MSRWLDPIRSAPAHNDKTDLTDKTGSQKAPSVLISAAVIPFRRQPEQLSDWKPDTKPTPEDAELYAEALRLHGPMSYGMAMRVLGWGGTRAGQAEDALLQAGRISFNNLGRAVLKEGGSDGGS
ncbi:hypothetical protein F9K81_17790 [Brucella anthropi]|uniref:Uncharacterized protein n=1 Tax=Brucella anthropi TaxID=529 RepID=A0A7V8BA38_BRUAN|nr:hypothetical protein [Brucella anthropi]NIH75696.1 hypothetical protein [Ochrobactrum sp. P20RRXII]PQZ67012.1 hypothetical protein CQ057_11275 [Ochrobactrum sp. MYb49]KAB2734780.1 hypothetical protein F9K89_20170 [Brucella anthropi]KAB2756109.1 hypothetical protein F9K81_17790 [Brucella anthropi]MBE0562951.1 hypothetical protein [Brucella anthropi]